jgi:hypothetical protein
MSLVQNLRFGWRALRRNPGFALTAIATLAAGIAVNTTIFSMVNGVLLRPLPYPDSDRLALLWTTNPQQNVFERAPGLLNVQDWRAARSFESIAWFRDEPVVLREEPEPEPMDAAFVSPNFFGMVWARPALGRFFTADETERGDCLAVLSYGLWQRRFGGSREVLGRVLQIETRRATIVGVLPADFRPLAQATQVWMPHTSASFFADLRVSRTPKFGWNVIARLRRGERGSSAGGDERHCRAVGGGVAEYKPGFRCPSDFPAGSGYAAHPAGADADAGGGRTGAADRVH